MGFRHWHHDNGSETSSTAAAKEGNFFPLSVPESLPGLREVARGCLGFFQCLSPFPVFKKLWREAPPAALLNYSDLWRG